MATEDIMKIFDDPFFNIEAQGECSEMMQIEF